MGNNISKSNKNKQITLPCGSLYQGDLRDSVPHGIGRLKSPVIGIYEGQFKNGKKSGNGKIFYSNGEFYNGGWLFN